MRVLLVSYEFPPDIGGESSYTHTLAAGLSSIGHQVTVVLPKKPGVDYLHDGPFRLLVVNTTRLPFLKVAGFIAALDGLLPELVRKEGIELVHFAFDYPSIPVRASGLGVPVVATVHHLHAAEAQGMLRTGGWTLATLTAAYRDFAFSLMELILVRGATMAIAVSSFTLRSLGEYLHVRSGKVRVVHNGMRVADFAPRGAARSGEGEPTTVLYVGRLDRSKGLEFLIDAFATVRSRAASRLVLVGQGKRPYTDSLRGRAAALGVGSLVTFTGRVSREALLALYAESTVVVLPSLMEGFGITLIEAMAAGKPCVATSVGAVPEVVRKGAGILVPPASAEELSKAILQVVNSPDRGAGMGARGRETVMEMFTEDRMVRETAEVYAECVKKANGLESSAPRRANV